MAFLLNLKVGISTIIILSACQSKVAVPVHEWGAKAQMDLQEAHNTMLENHPGPVDKENPGFNAQAEASLQKAMSLALDVENQAGYAAVLLAYTSGFRDGHFGVYANAQNSGQAEFNWPGMLPAWRAGQVRISHAEPAEDRFLGAELLSCDGRNPTDMILENVFQFSSGKPDQDAYWGRYAYDLFIDSKNPLIARPELCDFKLASGEIETHQLDWRPTVKEVFNVYRWKTAYGLRPKTGMEEVRPGEFWINLPDFSPNEAGVAKIRAVFAEVIDRREEIRNAKSIVFDMRGNQGGSSAWGVEMIEALWGKDFYENLWPAEDDTYIEWRLSEGNVDHLDWILDYLLENGHDDIVNDYFRPIRDGAKKAFAQGHTFFQEPDFSSNKAEKPLSTVSSKPLANPVNAPVYVLTHGTCASACLDFMDDILAIEGVTHIGYPTSSDTNYMEIRHSELSSGLATMAIPTKVYRNRLRASGETYDPEFQYDGFDWSDAAIKNWAYGIIHDAN